MTNCNCILCKIFLITNSLRKASLNFNLDYVDNCSYGGLKYAHLYIEHILELYDFTILDDKVELRIHNKTFDYGGFGYEDVSKVFYRHDELSEITKIIYPI